MQFVINDNVMRVSELKVSAVGIIPDVAVVKNVRISNALDAEGKKTDKVEVVRYDCVNPVDYSSFTIKVETDCPVITQEMLEATEELVFISIPVDEVEIRPYEINFGRVKVSIVAPFVKLVKN